MGQSDNTEDSTYSRHQDLCQKLNMDAAAASEAWKSYEAIRQNYILEGDQLQWIGCALFVACRKSLTPTVGRTGTNVEGNCVSLTRLLRLCNLPLIEFIAKSRFWADMANMPQDFRAKIDKLERNFAVSMVIFQKYQPMFKGIFKNPSEDTSKPIRSRRHRAVPCTPSRLFEFCWTLFICIKSAIPNISDDLVNSYHLLLVCCDLMYSNVLLSNRKDLFNPHFRGLPHNFHDEQYTPPDTANCIIDILCENYEGICVDARSIKEYSLKQHLNRLFNEKVLRGDLSSFTGILDPLNFDGNNKAINRLYEQHVLSAGVFDERIFLVEWRRIKQSNKSNIEVIKEDNIYHVKFSKNMLEGADANENIGSPTKMVNVSDLMEQLRNDKYKGNLAPPTPLTGRKYLRTKDICNVAPVSSATQNVIQLHNLIGCQTVPSDSLMSIFDNCDSSLKNLVEIKIKEFGEQFYTSYTRNIDEADTSSLEFGKKRRCLGQSLFYKLLDMVLKDEKRKKQNTDSSALLTNEVFLQCLYACCIEMVMYSYQNEDKMFPWVLSALNLEAYYFYKVIEIIVRVALEKLSRDIVKHLNRIEERILESLVWKKESPLWCAIESIAGNVPSCEETSLPGTFEIVDPNSPGQPVLRKIALDRGAHHDVQQSPISSASERFQSPVTAQGSAKKRLFPDGRISGGHSVLRTGTQSLLTAKLVMDGNQKVSLVTINEPSMTNSLSTPVTSTPIQTSSSCTNRDTMKPRRTGSVALFFRKFYKLASVRIQELCHSLHIVEDDLQKKIWTIFEYTIKKQTQLMKDRHLDQLLMCAVYVVCKLARIERSTFTEIMRCYRLQPQADSQIYRSVLIETIGEEQRANHNNANGQQENSTERETVPTTPTNMAGTSQHFGTEVRGDLIKFYNTVYVPLVTEFATRLVARSNTMNLALSPLPRVRSSTNSPVRRVTNSVMTRTLDPRAITASPAPQLSYCFSRSPAKDLEAINNMMISVDARKSVGKRLLADDADVEMTDAHSPTKKSCTTTFVARKLENIIGERRTQNQ